MIERGESRFNYLGGRRVTSGSNVRFVALLGIGGI
jgi:hypothetical protein